MLQEVPDETIRIAEHVAWRLSVIMMMLYPEHTIPRRCCPAEYQPGRCGYGRSENTIMISQSRCYIHYYMKEGLSPRCVVQVGRGGNSRALTSPLMFTTLDQVARDRSKPGNEQQENQEQ